MPPALPESSRASSVDSRASMTSKQKGHSVSVVVNKASAFVEPQDVGRFLVAEIVCHRDHEFLVRWHTRPEEDKAAVIKAYSWLRLEQLRGPSSSIYHVQNYVEGIRANRLRPENDLLLPPANSKKRKQSPLSEDSAAIFSNDNKAMVKQSLAALDFRRDYNCRRVIKDARITVKYAPEPHIGPVLPTAAMLNRAGQTSLDWAENAVADQYNVMLATFAPLKPRIRFSNDFDHGAPPLQVQLIDRYTYSQEVHPPDEETIEGCQAPCRPNMAHNCGCEYSRRCSCLEFAEVDAKHLDSVNEKKYARTVSDDTDESSMGLPKRFPYKMDGTMQAQCLESSTRYMLYECNDKCNCGPYCKTKVTQRGRKYGLEIFKTKNRGWGLRCLSDLRKGDFVDMYFGQIISQAEADKRDNSEYLFELDKFRGQLDEEAILVVDGTEMGGVTRFINHSCEPNCGMFCVSYNKNDVLRYNLAFFALDRIPKGEELTFDYQGQLEQQFEYNAADFAGPTSSQTATRSRMRCNCGAKTCRGYLFS